MLQRIFRLSLGPSQWMILTAIVLLVLLSVGYVGRVTVQATTRSELEQWEHRVQEARQRQALLEEQLTYVQTDAYVDQIARTILKWVKPGDVSVALILEDLSQAKRDQRGQLDQVMLPWQKWWDLFFGAGASDRG